MRVELLLGRMCLPALILSSAARVGGVLQDRFADGLCADLAGKVKETAEDIGMNLL